MELPANFNEFKTLIEFYRSQGVDCLSSNKEKWYFIYCWLDDYIVECPHKDSTWFIDKLGHREIVNHYQIPDINKINEACRNTIIDYLQRVCQIKMKPKAAIFEEKIIITNEFNYCQLILSKYLFETYCEYAALYNQQIITIPVIFDDNACKIFIECLNKASMSFSEKDLKHYEQVIDLMNFLCVKF